VKNVTKPQAAGGDFLTHTVTIGLPEMRTGKVQNRGVINWTVNVKIRL